MGVCRSREERFPLFCEHEDQKDDGHEEETDEMDDANFSIEAGAENSDYDQHYGRDEEENVLGFSAHVEFVDHQLTEHVQSPDQGPSLGYSHYVGQDDQIVAIVDCSH